MTTARASLINTLIYTGEGIRNDNLVHVLAYQNQATSHQGANAMVLPFPTSKEMGAANVIDTRAFPLFLRNISDASKHQTLGFDSRGGNMMKGLSRGMAQVFESGSYTVVLAEDVSQIPEALNRVADHKRPVITEEFLAGFGVLYPNQPIAVCCFDGTIKAEPLLWWYAPKSEDHLFVPTMDAHDGKAPRLTDVVSTDHIISVGSADDSRVGHQYQVRYRNTIPEDVISLLPKHVYGTKMGSTYKNGDMFIASNNLSAGSMNYKDAPKAYRGVSFAESVIAGSKFEMLGWG